MTKEHGTGWMEGDEKWVEDDGMVILRDFGYWAFHEYGASAEHTDAQWQALEGAALMLERWLNENWPIAEGGTNRWADK